MDVSATTYSLKVRVTTITCFPCFVNVDFPPGHASSCLVKTVDFGVRKMFSAHSSLIKPASSSSSPSSSLSPSLLTLDFANIRAKWESVLVRVYSSSPHIWGLQFSRTLHRLILGTLELFCVEFCDFFDFLGLPWSPSPAFHLAHIEVERVFQTVSSPPSPSFFLPLFFLPSPFSLSLCLTFPNSLSGQRRGHSRGVRKRPCLLIDRIHTARRVDQIHQLGKEV